MMIAGQSGINPLNIYCRYAQTPVGDAGMLPLMMVLAAECSDISDQRLVGTAILGFLMIIEHLTLASTGELSVE